MEILTITTILCVITTSVAIGMLTRELIAERRLTKDYASYLAKIQDLHNQTASKILEIQDKINVHEMKLVGVKPNAAKSHT